LKKKRRNNLKTDNIILSIIGASLIVIISVGLILTSMVSKTINGGFNRTILLIISNTSEANNNSQLTIQVNNIDLIREQLSSDIYERVEINAVYGTNYMTFFINDTLVKKDSFEIDLSSIYNMDISCFDSPTGIDFKILIDEFFYD
jgi:hypothetical protein